ncbi:MAG: hypothetical protein ACK4Z0_08350 [Sphingomonadaceae bacterium]
MTAQSAKPLARLRTPLLLAAAALTLSGCGLIGGGDKEAKAPTGQVVATLDGQEITALEVNAELAGTPIPPTMTRRDAEKAALNNIITRRMLVKAAEEQGLHKTPEFLLQQRRAIEQLKVQALARDIAQKVVAPTRDEAVKFMDENPSMFRERRVMTVDQIQFIRPDNIAELGFEQAKTMEAVEALLNANNIPFRRQPATLDTLGANPAFVGELNKVLDKNPKELFMFASNVPGAPGPVMLVNQVQATRVEPFTGDKAREFATNFLRNQRIQTALEAEVKKQQAAMKDRVVFQPGWEVAKSKAPDVGAVTGQTPPAAGLPSTPAVETSPAPAAPAPAAQPAG